MGLDNFPAIYPCKAQGVAILDDEGKIDCDKTISANKCPYHELKKSDPMVKDIPGVLGMFGADCWYRGKYGNYLLDQLKRWNPKFDEEIEDGSFYGDIEEDDESQGGITPDECLRISNLMIQYSESWVECVQNNGEFHSEEDKKRAIDDWIYAAWWLKFVGEESEGSAVWY